MRKRLPILIVVILVGVGAYWWTNRASADSSGLTASGTIETTDVVIAPEAGGRVLAVLAKEGDAVQAGQVIIHLDDSLLKAQLAQAEQSVAAAEASRKAAQANYDLLKAGAQIDQVAAAEQAVKNMQANVANAQAQLATLKAGPRGGDIAAAEASVAQAASQLKVMQDQYDKVTQCFTIKKPDGKTKNNVCPGLGTPEEQTRAALNAAQGSYDAAVARVKQA